jgi:hypothetical protein
MSQVIDDFNNGLCVILVALAIVGLGSIAYEVIRRFPYILWVIPAVVFPWFIGYAFRKW